MARNVTNALRIFRVFGIDVYVHWAWLLVVAYLVQGNQRYHNRMWAVLDVLTLFAIVLLHEFGHALACKSVGGKSDTIMLWPLGGVAMVQPPQRPGALLWSVAAGPLVNVILIPVTLTLAVTFIPDLFVENPQPAPWTDLQQYIFALFFINTILLIFNLLPIYPLDGGQIFQAILWFFIGRARSLLVAAFTGLVFGGMIGLLALYYGRLWTVLIAVFIVFQAWRGFRIAKILAVYEKQGIDPFQQIEK